MYINYSADADIFVFAFAVAVAIAFGVSVRRVFWFTFSIGHMIDYKTKFKQ